MPSNFTELVFDWLLPIADRLVLLLFTVTFLYIFWVVVDTWIINAAEDQKRAAGRATVTTAALVLVAMAGIWGIIQILRQGIFGIF